MEFLSAVRVVCVGILVDTTLSIAPVPVFATEGKIPASAVKTQQSSQQSLRSQSKSVPCTCRYRGSDFEQGQQVCIRGSLAICAMSLNNTSWTFSGQTCGPVS